MKELTLSLLDDKRNTLYSKSFPPDQIVAEVMRMFQTLGIEVERIDARIGCGADWAGVWGTNG